MVFLLSLPTEEKSRDFLLPPVERRAKASFELLELSVPMQKSVA
jgi:hypothetical protein